MAKIRIDEEALRSSSKNLETKINELISLNSRLNALINRINDSWDGEASQAYITIMLSYAKKTEGMLSVLREYKKYVDSAVAEFGNKDRESASKIRGSF